MKSCQGAESAFRIHGIESSVHYRCVPNDDRISCPSREAENLSMLSQDLIKVDISSLACSRGDNISPPDASDPSSPRSMPPSQSIPDLASSEISNACALSMNSEECAALEDLADYTYVAESWIPNAGNGLFASVAIYVGQRLGTYAGDTILSTRDAMRIKDKSYLMRLGPQCYVDTRDAMGCKARYINDCRVATMYNAIFVKDPARHCAYVIATCSIKANQEIFVDYGKWYWALLKPNKVSARYLQSKIEALTWKVH